MPPEFREFENAKFRRNLSELDFVASIFLEDNLYKIRRKLSALPSYLFGQLIEIPGGFK